MSYTQRPLRDSILAFGQEILDSGILRDFLRQWPRRARPTVVEVQGQHQEGCPYCAATKHLAAAHRYLSRGDNSGPFALLYQQLAYHEAWEASFALRASHHRVAGHDALQGSLDNLSSSLNGSGLLSEEERGRIKRWAWDLSERCLDLAEVYNRPGEGGP